MVCNCTGACRVWPFRCAVIWAPNQTTGTLPPYVPGDDGIIRVGKPRVRVKAGSRPIPENAEIVREREAFLRQVRRAWVETGKMTYRVEP